MPDLAGSAEARLTMALGAGFGLGVATTVGRVLAEFAPAPLAVAVGGLAGCALTAWLVAIRALMHRRAVLERWVTEAVAALRWHAEEMVADALLDAQSAFTSSGERRTESFL
jgi:xanthosine utilization system XapX-like protein